MVQVQESKIKFVVQDPLLQRFLEAKEALDELGKLLADVAARVRPYAEKYRGYSLEKTWVLNKLKKRYYYYYLKANDGRKPSSIYLGSMPADYPLCKFISGYLRKIETLQTLLRRIDVELRYVEAALNLLPRLKEAAEASAKKGVRYARKKKPT